jgi:phosphoribosylformylglycinamidine synthase
MAESREVGVRAQIRADLYQARRCQIPTVHVAPKGLPLYAVAKCRDLQKRVVPVKAKIHVYLKPGVLDPQGAAVAGALHNMGYDEVSSVRQGKMIELDLTGDDIEAARARVDEMCAKLLSNPVIESYSSELE